MLLSTISPSVATSQFEGGMWVTLDLSTAPSTATFVLLNRSIQSRLFKSLILVEPLAPTVIF